MIEGPEYTPAPAGVRAEEGRHSPPDRTADRPGGSRDGFEPDVGRRETEEALLDQVFFPLLSPAFAAFQALLADPPPPTEHLRCLLRVKVPWE